MQPERFVFLLVDTQRASREHIECKCRRTIDLTTPRQPSDIGHGSVLWRCACGTTLCAASAESMEAARLAYDGACARMDRAERARWKAQARGWRAIVAPILRDVFAMTEKENA